MSEPIVYESPKLTRVNNALVLSNGSPFICMASLTTLIEVPEYQEASELYIEVSTEQWSDDSGYEIWVSKFASFWSWGFTEEEQDDVFLYVVNRALNASGIPKNQPVKIYFRLTYCE